MNLNQQEKGIINTIQSLSPFPHTLLDAGCGEGAVIQYCQTKLNIEVTGVDQHLETVTRAINNGLNVKISDAREICFADEQFDWVIISNVLHHIPNASKALNECLRVAKFGVIASELWYDKSIKAQRHGFEIDTWCKTLHHALGYYHRMYLNAGEIIALIQDKDIADIEVIYGLSLIKTDINYWLNDQETYVENLPKNHVLLWELENLKLKFKNKLLCEPGWMQVVLKKQPKNS